MLNSYNDILLDINNSKTTDISTDTKNKIKDYIELKNSLGKNIKKLLTIKTIVKRGVIYMYSKDMNVIYNSIISNYIRNLNRNIKSKSTTDTLSDSNNNNDNDNYSNYSNYSNDNNTLKSN